MLGIVALLLGWLCGSPALATTIRAITATDDRIVVRFDTPIAGADSRVLAGARAVAIDLPPLAPGIALPAGYRLIAHGRGSRLIVPLDRPAVVHDGGFDAGGRGLGDPHSHGCRARILSRSGKRYTFANNCIDAGVGAAPRSTETVTMTVLSRDSYMIDRTRYRRCPKGTD